MRCIDCVRYPWRPDCDPSMLPPHTCHPALGLQRWTDRSASRERKCQYFEPRDKSPRIEVQEKRPAVEQVQMAAPEPMRPKTKRTTRRRRK